jgi:gpW
VTTETIADMQTRLDALDAAILKIATGGGVVLARIDDKTLQYGPGNLTLLRQMRDELADQVAASAGDCRRRRRLIYLTPFG